MGNIPQGKIRKGYIPNHRSFNDYENLIENKVFLQEIDPKFKGGKHKTFLLAIISNRIHHVQHQNLKI